MQYSERKTTPTTGPAPPAGPMVAAANYEGIMTTKPKRRSGDIRQDRTPEEKLLHLAKVLRAQASKWSATYANGALLDVAYAFNVIANEIDPDNTYTD